MNREEVLQRLKNIQSLPTLPPIVSKLNQMVSDEDVTAVKLGKVIEKDQVLTSKLLKMVNSSFFGFPQRISTVSNAIVLLGFNVIKTLIVTSSIFEVMQASDIGLFEHSLGCAAAAGLTAKKLGMKNPEEVSTAGLIHDLGKIVLRAELPDEYETVVETARRQDQYMREVEKNALGIGHGEIGGILARQWNLPERLVYPIEYHHTPEASPAFREVSSVVHFADILIRALGFGFGGDPYVPGLDHAAWSGIKLSKTDMKRMLEELDEKLVELRNFTMDIQKEEKEIS